MKSDPDMFPAYDDIHDPLLCFIYLNGGPRHIVNSHDTYDPLADYFGLPPAALEVLRKDKKGPHWNNMVQWGGMIKTCGSGRACLPAE